VRKSKEQLYAHNNLSISLIYIFTSIGNCITYTNLQYVSSVVQLEVAGYSHNRTLFLFSA
ncbi:MAG: hypothetical protein ACJ705_07715, partial [Nitrososphaeraceae archaeon]